MAQATAAPQATAAAYMPKRDQYTSSSTSSSSGSITSSSSSLYNLNRRTATELVTMYYKVLSSNNGMYDDPYSIELRFISNARQSTNRPIKTFATGALINIFACIQLLENENTLFKEKEETCVIQYGLSYSEVHRLYYAMRNYHLIHPYLSNKQFTPTQYALHPDCDVDEDATEECHRCGFTVLDDDITELFFYSTSYGLNLPICSVCIDFVKLQHASATAAAAAAATKYIPPCNACHKIPLLPNNWQGKTVMTVRHYIRCCTNCGEKYNLSSHHDTLVIDNNKSDILATAQATAVQAQAPLDDNINYTNNVNKIINSCPIYKKIIRS
jgi:hypothetical protein